MSNLMGSAWLKPDRAFAQQPFRECKKVHMWNISIYPFLIWLILILFLPVMHHQKVEKKTVIRVNLSKESAAYRF